MSSLPTIAVLPDRWTDGASNLSDQGVLQTTLYSFEDALRGKFDTDAHFVAYHCYDSNGKICAFPRCKKSGNVLSQIRELGGDIKLHSLVFDLDSPNHEEWTQETFVDAITKVSLAMTASPIIAHYTAYYSTLKGLRFIYTLNEPVPADIAENKLRWFGNNVFKANGLLIDDLFDWTRLFRLPNVVRPEGPTWEYGINQLIINQDNRVNQETIPEEKGKAASEYGEIHLLDIPQPDTQESMGLIETLNPKNQQMHLTEWAKSAKTRLKGRECYDCLFNNAPLASVGSRDSTMFKYVGQAISLLIEDVAGTTPEHVYGLFLGPTIKLEPDSGTPDWCVKLWDHILRLWALEEAKIQKKREVEEQRKAEIEGQSLSMIDGMRQWCDHVDLKGDEETAMRFLYSALIASVGGRTFFIMQKNGRYFPMPLAQSEIVPKIRELRMDDMIAIQQPNNDGTRMISTPMSDILRCHCTIVSEARVSVSGEGGYIDRITEPNATIHITGPKLNNRLVPTWNAGVDRWLKELFGEHYDICSKWIAWSLDFSNGVPICALSIIGDAGAGKKMLVQGLAETLEQPHVANAQDLTSDYQYNLLKSPFLSVNEGWPLKGARRPVDVFREVVAGDPIFCNRRYMHPVWIRCPYRVLFNANNMNVLYGLVSGSGNLTPEDREALAQRILHVDVGARASNFLRSKGGRKFTDGWISNDAGAESKYIVAKHFLWLYANREQMGGVGSRFLIEGNSHDAVWMTMRTRSGKSPLVIETIISMLNTPTDIKGMKVTPDGKLFILAKAILEHFRGKISKESRETMSQNDVNETLKGLVEVDHPGPFNVPGTEGRFRWHQIDVEVLTAVADRDGHTCSRLSLLHENRRSADAAAARQGADDTLAALSNQVGQA